MKFSLRKRVAAVGVGALALATAWAASACTGITFKAADGSVVFGRTLEWGSFDLIAARGRAAGHAYVTHMPDGKPGMAWTAKYGAVGIDAVGKDMMVDGMNEKGLDVGLFYHPGFAEYETYDPTHAAESMSPTDVAQYLLTKCSTVDEVRAAVKHVRRRTRGRACAGFAPPVHFIVTEPSGKAIVVEFSMGEVRTFDAPLGVITNAPTYDWHMTNLRNYINLSPWRFPARRSRT